MVRAILAGAKTQTRRVVNTREPLSLIGGKDDKPDPGYWGWSFDGPDHNGYMVLGRGHNERENHGRISIPCPYGVPSDRLWVRETWTHDADSLDACRAAFDCCSVPGYGPYYRATEVSPDTLKWKPSIFMPQWASRITLEVTEVRVQRLQEISEGDAKAEGVEPYTPPHGHISPDQRVPGPGFDRCRLGDQPHRLSFADLWDSINGRDGRRWSDNPFVWALSFRRVEAR